MEELKLHKLSQNILCRTGIPSPSVAFRSRAASIRFSEMGVGKPVADNYEATCLKGISALIVMRNEKIFCKYTK